MGNMKRGKIQGYGETKRSGKWLIWLLISLFLLFILSIFAVNDAECKTIYDDITGVEFIHNYDGDTVTITIPDWPPIIGQRIPIRVLGVDTPEIRGKCEEEKAMAYLVKNFVYKQLIKADDITIAYPFRGKYFRIVGDVIYDGKSLSEELISNGYAYEYDGGTKSNPWCE